MRGTFLEKARATLYAQEEGGGGDQSCYDGGSHCVEQIYKKETGF